MWMLRWLPVKTQLRRLASGAIDGQQPPARA